MSVIAEPMLATFDSDTALVRTTEGGDQVVARFVTANAQVETAFTQIVPDEWRVGFDATSEVSAIEVIIASIRVLNSVFQSVREFLEVQQPKRLFIPAGVEALAELVEAYLNQPGTPLKALCYRMSAEGPGWVLQKTASPSDYIG